VRSFLNISYLLVIVTVLFYLSWSSVFRLDLQKCSKVQIHVDTEGDLFFINTEMVEEMIFSKEDSLIGKAYEDINIYLLEEFVNEHPNIKKAELYLTLDGTLFIDVKQREPLARVFERNESYYLDEEMAQFALSDQYSARVLQVYWDEITESRIEILVQLIDLIDSDKFLKAQITAIEFDDNNELVVYPRVGEHKIILGEAEDFRNKFEKLKVFYRHGLGKVGWDRYSMINLKYHNQVVCKKR
jgi:cell division protein FtsQ